MKLKKLHLNDEKLPKSPGKELKDEEKTMAGTGAGTNLEQRTFRGKEGRNSQGRKERNIQTDIPKGGKGKRNGDEWKEGWVCIEKYRGLKKGA